VNDIDWSEQVQVRRHSPDWSEDGEAIGISDHILWDGITLDEAVRRVMALPPNERVGLSIFAQSELYSGKQIEALFDRLPQSKRSTN
jgi:hypothetical protein